MAWIIAVFRPVTEKGLRLEVDTASRSIEVMIETAPGSLETWCRSSHPTSSNEIVQRIYHHSIKLPSKLESDIYLKPLILGCNSYWSIDSVRIADGGLRTINTIPDFQNTDYRILGYCGQDIIIPKITILSNPEVWDAIQSHSSIKNQFLHFDSPIAFVTFFIVFMSVSLLYFLTLRWIKDRPIYAGFSRKQQVSCIVGLLILIDLPVFHKYLFGDSLFIFLESQSDSIEQSWPFMHSFIHQICSGNYYYLPQFGLGGNSLLINSLYGMFNPLNLLFLMRPDAVESLFTIAYLLKRWIGCIGFLFLLKRFKLHPFVLCFGGLTYAYSGFAIGFGSWVIAWGDSTLMWAPWLLYWIDRSLIQRYRWQLSIIAGLACISTYGHVAAYHIILLAVFHLATTSVFLCEPTQLINRIRLIIKILLSIVLGFGLFMIILLPGFIIVSESIIHERNENLFNFPMLLSGSEAIASFLGLFGYNMLNFDPITLTFKGIDFAQLSFPYTGTSVILLLALGSLSGKHYRYSWYTRCICVTGLLLIISPLIRSLFWGGYESYQRMTSVYFPIFFTFSACLYLNTLITKTVKIGLKPIIVSSLFIIILAILAIIDSQRNVFSINNYVLILGSLGMFYSSSLLVWMRKEKIRVSALVIFVLVSTVELTCFAYYSINISLHPLQKGDLNPKKFRNALADLQQNDQTFFRIGRIPCLLGTNDPLLYNYRGFSAYSSVYPPSVLRFLRRMDGYSGDSRRIIESQLSQEIKSLLSMKYQANIEDAGDIRFEPNENYVPFGALFEQIMTQSEFESYMLDERRKIFKSVLIVDGPTWKRLSEYRLGATIDCTSLVHSAPPRVDWVSHPFKHCVEFDYRIRGSIRTDNPGLLLLQIPFDVGWNVTIDDRATELFEVDFGLMAILITSGEHDVCLDYSPPGLVIGSILSIISWSIFVLLIMQLKRNRKERSGH